MNVTLIAVGVAGLVEVVRGAFCWLRCLCRRFFFFRCLLLGVSFWCTFSLGGGRWVSSREFLVVTVTTESSSSVVSLVSIWEWVVFVVGSVW